MHYRTLGRTGLTVSQLGFGAMRLPMTGDGDAKRVDDDKAVPMIRRAFEQGVNYIDTAVGYCNSDSQRAVGVALKGWRDKVIVSTKNHEYDDEKKWWQHLEDSLRLLDIESIDIYNHHGVNWKCFTEGIEPRAGQWMAKARDQGLIKHICCSFHDDNAALVKLIETGYPEVVTVQYNLLDRQLADGIARAREKNVGVVVMGPVGGGRLGADSDVLRTMIPGIQRVPELALRFVLANPNVTMALSGMSTMQHVEENLAAAADEVTLSDDDKAALAEHLERLDALAELYCTGCKYCLPCPQNVDIPRIFSIYNAGRVWGLWDHARRRYAALADDDKLGNQADACIACGQCEDKCPQNIPIRKQLKEAHEALTKAS
ncbi:MAG: aldo/keto reductase [Phycisphaerae bacterium]|nr:aldo/keto reductase [Phycisphaerae bacterium]